jgi:hypothetical protein
VVYGVTGQVDGVYGWSAPAGAEAARPSAAGNVATVMKAYR